MRVEALSTLCLAAAPWAPLDSKYSVEDLENNLLSVISAFILFNILYSPSVIYIYMKLFQPLEGAAEFCWSRACRREIKHC